jgi:hypothetical protein
VEPFLGNLIRYQDVVLELSALESRLAGIPAQIKAIDDEQEEAKVVIHDAKERHDASLKGRRDLERDLKVLEGKIDKYNDQSREVKTNEQYRAIMGEIQTVKDHIGEVEEKILISMEESDALQAQIGEAEKKVVARKPEFDAKRKVFEEEIAKLNAAIATLRAERDGLVSQIRPDLMEAYERVSKQRGEMALASIDQERCGGCGVRLRPAMMVEIRKNEAIHQCESCRRILYYLPPSPTDEAPPPAAESSPGSPSPSGDAS